MRNLSIFALFLILNVLITSQTGSLIGLQTNINVNNEKRYLQNSDIKPNFYSICNSPSGNFFILRWLHLHMVHSV